MLTCDSFVSLSVFYSQQLAALSFQSLCLASAVVSLLYVAGNGCEQRCVAGNVSECNLL